MAHPCVDIVLTDLAIPWATSDTNVLVSAFATFPQDRPWTLSTILSTLLPSYLGFRSRFLTCPTFIGVAFKIVVRGLDQLLFY